MNNTFRRWILKIIILVVIYASFTNAGEMYLFILGYIIADVFYELDKLFKDDE